MFKFVVLLSVVACAFGAAVPEGLLPQLGGRIIGGSAASISSSPWLVSLQRNEFHSCGGSIISPTKIVTAAHCVASSSPSELQIRAGSSQWNSGGVVIPVASITINEGFNAKTLVNDVAILTLEKSLELNSNIKVIGLATSNPENGAPATVSGWGTLASNATSLSDELQSVEVNIISQLECSSRAYDYGSQIKDNMMCAGSPGKDVCMGDSGAPLVSGGVLAGLASWGVSCGARGYPGVYMEIAPVEAWLTSNL